MGDKIVTLYDVELYAPKKLKSIYEIDNIEEQKKLLSDYYSSTVTAIIDSMVIETIASRYGVSVSDREVEEMLPIVSQQNIYFRDQVNEILEREQDITPELKLVVKNAIIQEKIRPMVMGKVVITDEDVKKYLEENSGFNSEITQYYVKIAFFDNRELYDEFVNSGGIRSFDNINPSLGVIADMGWVTPDHLIESVSEKVKFMKKGEVSSPVEDAEGRIMVAKIVDIRKNSVIPEDLYQKAYADIFDVQVQKVFSRWINNNKRSILISRFDI